MYVQIISFWLKQLSGHLFGKELQTRLILFISLLCMLVVLVIFHLGFEYNISVLVVLVLGNSLFNIFNIE